MALLAFVATQSLASLKPFFDKEEYLELLRINRSFGGTEMKDSTPTPKYSTKIYRSPEVGLKNMWELWEYNGVPVISIRGTVASPVSWGENFYAAMIPAQGTLHLENDFSFDYKFAENTNAKVHVGWAIGTAYLQRDILPKIDSLVQAGKKEFYITGHSQGGALSYLLRSYFYYLQQAGRLSANLKFKTVTSAAPKPGNLPYAYDYETINFNGWSYSVVNALDWVPESPFSIQTIPDFTPTNPFSNADKVLKKQKFLARVYGKYVYKSLDKSTRKAQKIFEKYLGNKVYSQLKKQFPELKEPVYEKSMAYVRVGYPIVLMPDEQYLSKKKEPSSNAFEHHSYWGYYQLTERMK